MQIRKWLALLVSAALALSLLAGCGGKNQSLGQVILDLLDGQYANVTVEIDPDLEGDLRQAVHEGETEEEIRAALEKILGSGVSFRLIGDGQQGDTAWNLILYPGSDPDAAARSAFTEWSKVFGSLPRDGQYTAQIAMIETENGYAILVKATVDKAASRDDDDDDDEPEEPEDPGYTVDEKGNYTVNDSDGLQNLLTGQANEAEEITDAREKGFGGVTIKLAANTTYTVSQTFTTTSFKGILQGKDKASTIIKLTDGDGLFAQIDTNGKVENITFDVQTAISNTYISSKNNRKYTRAGAVAGLNNGTITNCDVTINASESISITAANESTYVCAGGIAGENQGTISNCHVNGSYKGTGDADIRAANENNTTCAGGIAGYNQGTVDGCSVSYCKIKAEGYGNLIAAGGLVGLNENDSMPSTSVTGYYITAEVIGHHAATVTSDDPEKQTDSSDLYGVVYAGTRIGNNDGKGPVGF